MAVWLAATAMRRARRRGTAGPRGSVVAIVIGGVGVLISAVLLAGFALFGKQATYVLPVPERSEHRRRTADVPDPVHPRYRERHPLTLRARWFPGRP